LIGYSTFAKGYQADPNWDPHTYFGGQLVGITYEEALKRKKEDKSFKKIRAVAKAANFSFPGGVGAKTLHGQFMSLYESGQLEKPYSLDECYAIKDSWLAAYPEMKEYFDIAQYHAQTGDPVVMPVSGRVRGGLSFCNAANTWFQGIASDLAKRAFYRVSQASYVESGSPLYGSRPLVFIHDEILAEVPIDKAHEAALEIQRLMSVEGNNVCPDVPILAEAALATRWIKAMEPAYTHEGRLTAWDLK
jgi:DNA polymerase I-like protein with 3'-5' exonuclease and polymerase domains